MKTMIRKPTGVKFTPQEFRELNYCLGCSRMLKIGKKEKCLECIAKDLKPCEVCGRLLEKGIHKHYAYDIKEDKRDEELIHYVSKKNVKEFLEIEEVDNIFSDTLCVDCKDWKSKIKNVCWICGDDFHNSEDYYKLNGNMCELCLAYYRKNG